MFQHVDCELQKRGLKPNNNKFVAEWSVCGHSVFRVMPNTWPRPARLAVSQPQGTRRVGNKGSMHGCHALALAFFFSPLAHVGKQSRLVRLEACTYTPVQNMCCGQSRIRGH